MKRRLAALLLSVCLLTTTALAAGSTENFIRLHTYQDQFSDLSRDSVFYDNVAALYEYGLSVGKPDGTFGLTDSVTVSQMVIFAARIHSLYHTGDPEAGAASCAAEAQAVNEPYLLYLKAQGILGNELDSRLYLPATRAEVAHLLANLLPPEALPPIHEDLVAVFYATHRAIPDVTEYTPYYQDILQLYRTGISQGSDQKGTYFPDAPITRGAAAAMLTRMVDPQLRTSPTWYSAAGTTLADLVEDAQPVPAPTTPAEMDACIRHMLAANANTLSLSYPALTAATAQERLALALRTIKTYCEQGCNLASCTYTSTGQMDITFSATAAQGAQLQELQQDTMLAATAIHDMLWETGEIAPSMSDREKAQVYFEWICGHASYDHEAQDDSISHLAYGLFYRKQAVCDGYTGAYNIFLKLEGIPCTAVSGGTHIWTAAVLDGEEVHIDVTWGDHGSQPDLRFFAMTPEQSAHWHPQ